MNLTRGPRVVVRFTGDPLPEAERERLVPIRTEGSADEDLLEDSSRAIEDYLYTRGYRDANAVYTSKEQKEELVITFEVDRGPRYLVRNVSFTGNMAISEMELLPLIRLKTRRALCQVDRVDGHRRDRATVSNARVHACAGQVRRKRSRA